jgi:Glycosyl transferase family 2
MTSSGLIVLVTTELFPFTSGGIGRLCYNVLTTMSEEERRRTLVILTTGRLDRGSFSHLFPEVRLMEVDGFDFSTCEPRLRWALDAQSGNLGLSVKLLAILQSVAATERIGFVEFPDWSGFGFATIQHKRLTGFLHDATIAVRLHSTETMLVLSESRLLSQRDLLRYDLERLCLQDCDLILGHIAGVAEETRAAFGLEAQSWARRLIIADPPLTLNGGAFATRTVAPAQARHIVFSSKFQECKRPEVFVRGVAHFLATSPFSGKVEYACPMSKNAYTEAILAAIPPAQRKRHVLHKGLSAPQRDVIIAGSLIVFASGFESYCLAAYEAAALGAVVVLNHANPAFGETSAWRDGENCLTFDGTAPGLAAALHRAMTLTEPLQVLRRPDVPQAWRLDRPAVPPLPDPVPLGFAAVVVNQGEGAVLSLTLASLMALDPRPDQLIVVDDGSTDADSLLALADLEAQGQPHITVLRQAVTQGYAPALQVGLKAVQAPLTLLMRSGFVVTPRYVAEAVQCLSRDPGIAMVCGQVRSFLTPDQLAEGIGPMTMVVGDAAISGTGSNSYATFGMVLRSDLARQIGFRAETGYLCDWAFAQRLVRGGHKAAVSVSAGIARRIQVERDFGTPIDEYARLAHIVVTDRAAPLLDAPATRLGLAVTKSSVVQQGVDLPSWYVHMLEHGYEPEVSFMAEFFGHSRLGRFIRRNSRFSAFLERLVNRLSRLGPKG